MAFKTDRIGAGGGGKSGGGSDDGQRARLDGLQPGS